MHMPIQTRTDTDTYLLMPKLGRLHGIDGHVLHLDGALP